jgi:hypothetical protein
MMTVVFDYEGSLPHAHVPATLEQKRGIEVSGRSVIS